MVLRLLFGFSRQGDGFAMLPNDARRVRPQLHPGPTEFEVIVFDSWVGCFAPYRFMSHSRQVYMWVLVQQEEKTGRELLADLWMTT